MTNAPPKVSVLIPTFNYARYLPEALDSVLAQDWGDFEVLIADDCSSDGTAAVVTRYAAQDNRIRWHVHSARLGMVENWNWCLAHARGEFIKFVFADDGLASAQALRTLATLLEENPSVSLAASARLVLDADSHPTAVWSGVGQPGVHSGQGIIVRCLEEDANLVGEPSAVMFRRESAAAGFDVRYRQLVDLEMWFRLLEQGDLAYSAEPLCWFRRHAHQQTEVNRRAQASRREHLRLLCEYRHKPYVSHATFARLSFRGLYYARRRAGHDEESLHLQRQLAEELGVTGYAWRWLLHKLTRPLENLLRHIALRRTHPHRAQCE